MKISKHHINRFNSKFIKTRKCWIWTGARDRDGYGLFKMKGVMHRAHRIAWQILNDAIPKGKFICHKCDNPPCVNPKHLFQASPAGNIQDRDIKFRHAFGEKNAGAKLKERQVVEIIQLYKSGLSQQKIADMFGMGQTSISRITRRTHWKHINL